MIVACSSRPGLWGRAALVFAAGVAFLCPAGAKGESGSRRKHPRPARQESPVPVPAPPSAEGVAAGSRELPVPVPAPPSGEGVAAAPQAPPLPAPTPPVETAFGVHANWNDRLVIESEDKRFYLQPIGILQSLFSVPINPAGDYAYEGTGFTFRRAALGFDSRLFGTVRTFFLSNIASGPLTLWDFFTDLDFFDGQAVLRVGRFRPWLARQRLLAGDRYQMIQLPAAMTDLLEIGDFVQPLIGKP